MKNTNFIYPVFIAILFISSMFVSCKKAHDACAGITCKNGGVCMGAGICSCPSGYTGDKCEVPATSVLAGKWVGTDCYSNPDSFIISTVPNSAYNFTLTMIPKQIVFCSGSAPLTILQGTIDKNNPSTFTITAKNINDNCGGDPWTISASGYLFGNTISVIWSCGAGTVVLPDCMFTGKLF